MKHPLPVALGLGVLAAVVAMLLIPSGGDAEPVDLPPATPADTGTGAPVSRAPSPPPPPPWPAKAWDDFRYGLHLRYPKDWEERASADLPAGIPGSVILAVGPTGEPASLAIYHVGVLVPRPGIEAMGRRGAELAGTAITDSTWTPFARRDAFRVRSEGETRAEETILFSHRRVLFAVRTVAPRGDAAAMATLSEVAGGLRLD